jgi:hypothetical protein
MVQRLHWRANSRGHGRRPEYAVVGVGPGRLVRVHGDGAIAAERTGDGREPRRRRVGLELLGESDQPDTQRTCSLRRTVFSGRVFRVELEGLDRLLRFYRTIKPHSRFDVLGK